MSGSLLTILEMLEEAIEVQIDDPNVINYVHKLFATDELKHSFSEKDPRNLIIQVPTSDREEASNALKDFISSKYPQYTVGIANSRGNPIGVSVYNQKRRVIRRFLMKPISSALIRNKGDVAEGLLTAAVAASFVAGGKRITTEQVEEFLLSVQNQENESTIKGKVDKSYTIQAEREDKTIDTIICQIKLAKINFDDLMDLKKRSSLNNLLRSVVAYANSEEVVEASLAVATNGVPNQVKVVADGIGKQKSTKVDITIFLDGQPISIGRISLKAGGTDQLGQVGGSWDGISGMFRLMFGIELDPMLEQNWNLARDPSNRSSQSIKNAARVLYSDAFQKINQTINSPGVEDDVDLIKTIAKGLNYQVALEEEGVILIHLDKGDFKKMNFSNLEKVLRDNNISFEAQYNQGGPTIKILAVIQKDDSVVKKPLFQIRFKQEGDGKVIRNYVEKQSFMVDLLTQAKK
jgi:hypothetical protein